jgi:hypothetical protein
MNRHNHYSFIYNLQRIILLIFFATTAIAISIPLSMLILGLSPNKPFILVISLLVYIILMIVVGSMIHVISFIPFNLATAFDPIKNDIASGRISTIEQLGERITTFTVQFYDFSFLDIAYAVLHTEESGMMANPKNSQLEHILQELDIPEKSRQTERIIQGGKIPLEGNIYHLYILPIWLGENWLGYLALLSEQRISRFFQRFLMEYEENFLDDQIMHLVRFNKMPE